MKTRFRLYTNDEIATKNSKHFQRVQAKNLSQFCDFLMLLITSNKVEDITIIPNKYKTGKKPFDIYLTPAHDKYMRKIADKYRVDPSTVLNSLLIQYEYDKESKIHCFNSESHS